MDLFSAFQECTRTFPAKQLHLAVNHVIVKSVCTIPSVIHHILCQQKIDNSLALSRLSPNAHSQSETSLLDSKIGSFSIFLVIRLENVGRAFVAALY